MEITGAEASAEGEEDLRSLNYGSICNLEQVCAIAAAETLQTQIIGERVQVAEVSKDAPEQRQ